MDDHQRPDADAGVRTERRAPPGNPARGESPVHGVRGRWHMVRLQGQTKRGLCGSGRRRHRTGSGAG